MTRQVYEGAIANPDGTYNLNVKVALVDNVKNIWSAIGSISAFVDVEKYGAVDGNLVLNNVYVL